MQPPGDVFTDDPTHTAGIRHREVTHLVRLDGDRRDSHTVGFGQAAGHHPVMPRLNIPNQEVHLAQVRVRGLIERLQQKAASPGACLLYTSDAADE